jgi:hypothetical protein
MVRPPDVSEEAQAAFGGLDGEFNSQHLAFGEFDRTGGGVGGGGGLEAEAPGSQAAEG